MILATVCFYVNSMSYQLARMVLYSRAGGMNMTKSWSFDPSHSGIGFAVRHLMISKVRGSFDKWSGTFEYDEADPTKTQIDVRIDAASINTKEEKRDGHLRSPDFFDVENHPELRFRSTLVER